MKMAAPCGILSGACCCNLLRSLLAFGNIAILSTSKNARLLLIVLHVIQYPTFLPVCLE
jgi:hypothetical protein